MKRHNWLLIVLACGAVTWFVVSRTVFGPPSKAMAEDNSAAVSTAPDPSADEEEPQSDAKRRYLSNQARHWRYVVLKRN